MEQLRCKNPICRHVEDFHDEHGCLIYGCECGRMEFPMPVQVSPRKPRTEQVREYAEQAA